MKKDELNAVRTLTAAISREEDRLQRLKDWALRITSTIDGLPHATGYKPSAVENLTVQIVDCEKQISALRAQRSECQSRLLAAIDAAIEDCDIKDVLAERYIFCLDFQSIQAKLHFSRSSVFTLHRKGVKRLMD